MSRSRNLLYETLETLQQYYLKEDDIEWIGSHDGEYVISWEEFKEISKDINYDGGYGGQVIAKDIVIVGKNWWLSRGEYDGSEWWEYNEKPEINKKPNVKNKKFTKVKGGSWESLSELNTKEDFDI